MTASFFEPDEFFAEIETVMGNDLHSAMSEFFEDDRVLDMLSPYPELPAIAQFASWFADCLIYEATTEAEIVVLPAKASEKNDQLQPLPIELAFKRYGIDDDGFSAWLRNAGKELQHADADDIYEYIQELRCSGWVEELGDKMAEAILPKMLSDFDLLTRFQECVAEKIRNADWTQFETDVALMFEGPGRLRVVPPPRRVVRRILERDKAHCAGCARAAAGPTAKLVQLVPCAVGGLNDLGNLRLACPASREQPG